METIISIVIGLCLFIWIIKAKTCFSRLLAIGLFIFLLWIYRLEVAWVVDRIGQVLNVDDVSGRFHYLLTNLWQKIIQWLENIFS